MSYITSIDFKMTPLEENKTTYMFSYEIKLIY